MKNIIFIKLGICFLGLFFFNISNAFEMYIHTGYNGIPDFSEYGFLKSEIIYEQQIYNFGEDRSSINSTHIEKIASLVKSKQSNIVILDIEYWMKDWRKIGYIKKNQIMNRYANTIYELRSLLPAHKLGYYSVVPAWPHWDIVNSEGIFRNWQKKNDIRAIVGNSVDIIYPDLYTYHANPEDWKVRAAMIISKARQIAKGKKVIAFVWPRYHQSSKPYKNGYRALPAKYWRYQLEYVKSIADGFVIWDGALGNKGDWDPVQPWWIETKAFIEEHFPMKRPASR